jgi:hypothetical protein
MSQLDTPVSIAMLQKQENLQLLLDALADAKIDATSKPGNNGVLICFVPLANASAARQIRDRLFPIEYRSVG